MKNTREYLDRLEVKYSSPYIQIPNKLIAEIHESMEKEGKDSTAYAFSYIVLNAFLYKYVHYTDSEKEDYLTLEDIKEILKLNRKNHSTSYITKKKNGFLIRNDFIETTTDIPVKVSWVENPANNKLKIREIIRLSEMDEYIRDLYKYEILNSPNFNASIPEFMIDYGEKKGTLNDYSNTFTLTYKEFSHFIFNTDYTLRDFLFYCHLKSKMSIRQKDRIGMSYEEIEDNTGMCHTVVKKSADKLNENNIIKIEKPTQGKRNLYNRPANVYYISKSFNQKTKRKKNRKIDKKFNKVSHSNLR